MSAGPILVLIVDDEPLMRWALSETLIGRGCRVVEAADARSAVDVLLYGSQPFDVVLLDYHLPDTADPTPLATIRQLSPGSQVIMMTAFMTPDVTTRAVELGACHVRHKPLEMDALAALVLSQHRASPPSPPGIRGC